MNAFSDGAEIIMRNDVENELAPIDLCEFAFTCNGGSDRGSTGMLNVHKSADGTHSGIKKRLNRFRTGVFHKRNQRGRCVNGKQSAQHTFSSVFGCDNNSFFAFKSYLQHD